MANDNTPEMIGDLIAANATSISALALALAEQPGINGLKLLGDFMDYLDASAHAPSSSPFYTAVLTGTWDAVNGKRNFLKKSQSRSPESKT